MKQAIFIGNELTSPDTDESVRFGMTGAVWSGTHLVFIADGSKTKWVVRKNEIYFPHE